MSIKPTAYIRTRPALSLWGRGDYNLMVLGSLALLPLILVAMPLPALLRVPLGLAVALFGPGYALMAALFQRSDFDLPARLGLSFGLSIAVLPLLALILDVLPWGIRPWPIALSISIWVVLCSCIAIVRTWVLQTPDVAEYPTPNGGLVGWWRRLDSRGRLRYLAGALAVVAVVAAGTLTITAPDPTTRMTEFYALGSEGLAEGYPRQVAPGETMQVQLGIANHEGAATRYRVEVRAGEQMLAQAGPITLADGATSSAPISYALAQPGDDQQIDLLLFHNDDPAPYRRLRLWVNVRTTP